MPPQEVMKIDTQTLQPRLAIRKAKMITAMLQGTMGLEGQALDRKTLRAMTKETTRDLMATR